MLMWENEPPSDATAYATFRGLEITGGLGRGIDGTLWKVRRKGQLVTWAMKIHRDGTRYEREKACYKLLKELRIIEIRGFNVPKLIRTDDAWKVIEMSVVMRPYILDFAQAFLMEPPEFSEEVWEERLASWQEDYGDDWPSVKRALAALKTIGIHYLDVHHGNIAPA